MTDTLTQRARDAAGRLKRREIRGDGMVIASLPPSSEAIVEAAAIISELVGRIEVMRDALGNIARDSNPDWTENRVYPQDVLDEVNRMAVEAYYAPPSVLGKQEGEG